MNRRRWVILPIDAITAILADYAGMVGFPPDAKPIKWFLNPEERKMRLVVASESAPAQSGPTEIKFDLHQTFLVN